MNFGHISAVKTLLVVTIFVLL